MDKDEIKRRVSINQMLTHYGSPPDHKGKFHCPFPQNHNHGDAHKSGAESKDRAYCHSQQCFGERGSDIFEIVKRMEHLATFPEQKAWIIETFGLSNGTPESKKTIAATYDYTDASGTKLYQTVKYDPKDFRQRRPDGNGGWIWNLQGVRLVLYRLPQIIEAETVFLVEGEKDVEAAYALGLPQGYAATTSPMGANKWKSEYGEALRGKTVVICPDQDAPGQKHGKQIAGALSGVAKEILWLDVPQGKDLSEWIESTSATGATFHALLEHAKPVEPDFQQDTQKAAPQAHSTTAENAIEAEIERLAALSPLAYALARKFASKRLEIGLGTLDSLVKTRRREDKGIASQGKEIVFDEPDMWEEAVDGGQLMQQLTDLFTRFLVLPQATEVAISLWVLHAYCLDVFGVNARLALLSPEKRCGKSRAMRTHSITWVSCTSMARACRRMMPKLFVGIG